MHITQHIPAIYMLHVAHLIYMLQRIPAIQRIPAVYMLHVAHLIFATLYPVEMQCV